MTAIELIKSSIRLIGTLGNDVVLAGRESRYPLEALNLLLESWSLDSLFINKVEQETFTLQIGVNPHTWGIGGDFDSARPTRLLSVKIRITSGADLPVRILAYDDYAAIRLKTISNSIPQYVYLDMDSPEANLYLYPVPSAAYDLVCYSEKPISDELALGDTLSFPPGYLRALKYALAIEIGREFNAKNLDDIKLIANDAISKLKRANKKLTTLSVDPALLSPRGTRYNIYRDE